MSLLAASEMTAHDPRRVYSTAIAALATRAPDSPCLSVDGHVTTIGRLDRRANAVSLILHDAGVRTGDIVAIPQPNGEDFFAAAFGAWKIGATPMPLASTLPDPERLALLDVARPAYVVDHVTLNEAPNAALPPGTVSPRIKAQPSGGSTGTPKIIVTTTPSVMAPDELDFGYALGPAMFVGGPVHHTGPFGHAVEGILHGRLVLMQRVFDPEAAIAAIASHRAHFAWLVPTMLHRIMRLPRSTRDRYDVSSLQYVIHGAAATPAWLKRAWIDWIGPTALVEIYGATEAIAATRIRGDEWLEREGSVGRPFFGEMRICGTDGRELPPGELGEVYMRGPDGAEPFTYLGAPSRRRLDGGWESVGDLGWKDADGYLFLADRRGDLIITGGANVFPAEVQAAIERHPAVVASIAYGLPDEDLGEVVAASVQVDREVSFDELRDHVRSQIAAYKVPRRIDFTREPLRNEAGKIVRSQRGRIGASGADPARTPSLPADDR